MTSTNPSATDEASLGCGDAAYIVEGGGGTPPSTIISETEDGLVERLTAASTAARKAGHHFPADALAEAVGVIQSQRNRITLMAPVVEWAISAAITVKAWGGTVTEHPGAIYGWDELIAAATAYVEAVGVPVSDRAAAEQED